MKNRLLMNLSILMLSLAFVLQGFGIDALAAGTADAADKTIDIEVSKEWKDGFNVEDSRPDKITVDLKNGDEVVKTIDISPDDDGKWTGEFADVPRFDEDGKEIKYEIVERPVDGYMTSVTHGEIISPYKYPENVSDEELDTDTTTADKVNVHGSSSWFIQQGLRTDYIEGTQVVFNNANLTIAKAKLTEYDANNNLVPTNERVLWKTNSSGTNQGDSAAAGTEIRFKPQGTYPTKTVVSTDHYIILEFPNAVTVLDGTDAGSQRSVKVRVDNISVYKTTNDRNWQRFLYSGLWAGPGDGSHAFGGESMDLTFTIDGVSSGNVLLSFTDIDVTSDSHEAGASRRESVYLMDGFDDTIYTVPLNKNTSAETSVVYTYFEESNGAMRAYSKGQDKNSTLQSGFVTRAQISDSGFKMRWTGTGCATLLFSQIKPFKLKTTVDENTAAHIGGTITEQGAWRYRAYGEPKVITVKPDQNYHIKYLKIDGNEIALDQFDEQGYMEVPNTGYSVNDPTLNPGTVNAGKETLKLYQREKGVIDIYLPAQYFAVDNTAPARADHWIDTGFETNGLAQNYIITNELMTTIDGTKTWVSGNTEHVDNSSLNFTLKRRLTSQEPGTETEVPFDKASQMKWDGNNYVVSGLPAYDKDGEKYIYTITETPPAGFDVTQNGNDIINTLKQQQITVQGKKTWKDGGKTHDNASEVIVTLSRATWDPDTKTYGRPEALDLTPVWSGDTYKFDNLPKYDDARYEYRYTVTEAVADSINTDPSKGDWYECKPDSTGRNFINTLRGITSFSGTKTWLDGDKEHDNTQDLTLVLYRESSAVAKRSFSISGDMALNWDGDKYTYTNLPKYDDEGNPFTYSVRESRVMGKTANAADYDIYYDGKLWDFDSYASATEAYSVTGTNITNALRGTITVNKKWSDDNNRDGKRPEKVTIHLMNGDDEVGSAELEGDSWTHTFEDIPLYDSEGELIDYTIIEDPIKDSDDKVLYTLTVGDFEWNTDKTGLTVDITNTHETEKTSVKVTKVWDDADDADGLRPDELTLDLLADGSKVDSVTLPKNGSWSYEFTGLNKYEAGKEIKYTAEEPEASVPAGYTPAYSTDKLTVTNTHVRYTKTALKGTKTLNGRDMKEGEFEFTLEAADDDTKAAVTDGKVVLPSGNASAAAAADGTAGEFKFGDIVFKAAGTYKFKVSEVRPASSPSDGITYDTDDKTVTVEVIVENNALKVSKTTVDGGKQLSFTNTYSASGDYTPEGEKTLTGQSIIDDGTPEPEFRAIKPAADSSTADNDNTSEASASEEAVSEDYVEAASADNTQPASENNAQEASQDTAKNDEAKASGSAESSNDAADASVDAANASVDAAGNASAVEPDSDADNKGAASAAAVEDDKAADDSVDEANADIKSDIQADASEANKSADESGTTAKASASGRDSSAKANAKVPKGDPVDMAMEEGMFRFEIRYTNGSKYRNKVASEGYNTAAAAGETADIIFGQLDYTTELLKKLIEDGAATQDADGKYHISYYVVETQPDEDCFQYNTTVESFEAVITDDGKGKLTVTAVPSDVIAYTNRYITDTATVSLDGLKVLTVENGTRSLKEGDFEFTVECVDGAPAPERLTATNDAGGAVSFGEIEFTKGDIGDASSKTFTYNITETKGSLGGMTYDGETKTVTVTVTDDGAGHIKATTDPEAAPLFTFNNTYKPEPASETVNKDIEITKILKDATLKAGQFSFTIEPANDETKAAEEAGDITMPSKITVKNAKDGSVAFDSITYNKAGTYTFLISENIPDGAVKKAAGYEYEGILYDSTNYTVVVKVIDDENGKLVVDSQSLVSGGNKAIFTNKKIPETPPDKPDKPDKPGKPDNPTKPGNTPGKDGKVKTGDESNIGLWIGLMLAAVAAAGGIAAYRRKNK